VNRRVIEVPVLSQALGALGVPLSLVVSANGFVFVSGIPPMDCATGAIVRGDIETQTRASIEALGHCLQAAGSSLDNVVSTRVYASNAGYYAAINEIYGQYFASAPPARTFVAVGSWPRAFDVEIECTALA